MRRRKLSLGGSGAGNDSAKSKLGNKCFHGNKRHLSILIMHINAKGEIQNPLYWVKSGSYKLYDCYSKTHVERCMP